MIYTSSLGEICGGGPTSRARTFLFVTSLQSSSLGIIKHPVSPPTQSFHWWFEIISASQNVKVDVEIPISVEVEQHKERFNQVNFSVNEGERIWGGFCVCVSETDL